MFDETRIFLNNSRSKWLSIGIKPEPMKISNAIIKNFVTEVLLCGEKCFDLPLSGVAGLLQLLGQLREIPYFKNDHNEVSSDYFYVYCYQSYLHDYLIMNVKNIFTRLYNFNSNILSNIFRKNHHMSATLKRIPLQLNM